MNTTRSARPSAALTAFPLPCRGAETPDGLPSGPPDLPLSGRVSANEPRLSPTVSLLHPIITRLAALILSVTPCAAQSLLKNYSLNGDSHTTRWTFLASQNPSRFPDNFPAMKGTMTVASPGYGASMGLYSWTGPYSITVNQPATTAPVFDISHVVFQLDVTWDPATTFPAGGGPKLSYNGGNQQIPATLPMIVDGTRVVENNTGVPEMEGIESFAYRGITWQWDLTGITDNIQTVRIQMPFANHTSLVGAQIDVASQFSDVSENLTPLQEWRVLHFGSPEDDGEGADNADPDRDGLANLIEYALGTNPQLSADGRQFAPAAAYGQNRLSLGLNLPSSLPDEIVCRVQVSDSLSGWSTLATKAGSGSWIWSGEGSARISEGPVSGGRLPVTVSDDTTGRSRRMMRLEISR